MLSDVLCTSMLLIDICPLIRSTNSMFLQLDTNKSLVDQCVQGEGMVQINLEVKSQPGESALFFSASIQHSLCDYYVLVLCYTCAYHSLFSFIHHGMYWRKNVCFNDTKIWSKDLISDWYKLLLLCEILYIYQ